MIKHRVPERSVKSLPFTIIMLKSAKTLKKARQAKVKKHDRKMIALLCFKPAVYEGKRKGTGSFSVDAYSKTIIGSWILADT